MPRHLCPRRRRLYADRLVETKTYLASLTARPPFTATDAARLKGALQDPGLVDALEEILDAYIAYGVARDLKRLAQSQVLFRRSTSSLPTLNEVLPLGGANPTYTGQGQKAARSVTPGGAYTRYFDWFVDPDEVVQGGRTMSGAEAFSTRYPLLAHAVRTATANHQTNIRLACLRIAKDWDAIETAFFSGRTMHALKKIQTTGNDFHKGGKQVLILTFDLDGGRTGRVVYKPSAVEIDCRIVGDTATVNRVAPGGYRQDASLIELLNRYIPQGPRPGGFAAPPLPTYVILPFNNDSVPDAYGYIQFLTHEPDVDVRAPKEEMAASVGRALDALDTGAVRGSDWILPASEDGRDFHYQLGALLALALSVSLCDLHVQNLIVHKRQPYLIDLEDALKRPMSTVADTYLPEAIGRLEDPIGAEFSIRNDGRSDLEIRYDKPLAKPSSTVLYRRARDRGYVPVVPDLAGDDGDGNRRALARGVVDAFEALAETECNDAVVRWVQGLDRTVVRFVHRPTAELAQNCRDLYMLYCENAVGSLLDGPGGYKGFRSRATGRGRKDTFFFNTAVSTSRTLWNARIDAYSDDARKAWVTPFFALEHPLHAWRDYLNGDVPSFYHRLGSTDLLNTMGDPVDVAAVIAWQDDAANIDRPGDLKEYCGRPAVGGGVEKTAHIVHFFPERPIDMIVRQLGTLRDRWPVDKAGFLGDALARASILGGDLTALAHRLAGADNVRAKR